MPEFLLKISPAYAQAGNNLIPNAVEVRLAIRTENELIELPFEVTAKA